MHSASIGLVELVTYGWLPNAGYGGMYHSYFSHGLIGTINHVATSKLPI